MTSRARHEHQIKSFSSQQFEDALASCAFSGGLSWLTDDQIEDIRELLIDRAWYSHKINRENRKRWAASASLSASQKEPEHV